jgi:hypothetical protein
VNAHGVAPRSRSLKVCDVEGWVYLGTILVALYLMFED